MNLLESFFRENNSVLTVLLKSEGFTSTQASRFLEETAHHLLESVANADINQLISELTRSDVAGLFDLIDIDAMAECLGMAPDHVKAGVFAMRPVFADSLLQSNKSIAAMLAMYQRETKV